MYRRRQLFCLFLLASLILLITGVAYAAQTQQLNGNSANTDLGLDVLPPGNQSESIKLYRQIIDVLKTDTSIPYAGAYIDDNDVLNVGLVENKIEHQNLFRSLAKNVPIKFYNADYTFKELRALQFKMRNISDNLIDKGVPLEGWYIDEIDNKLCIVLKEITDSNVNEITNIIGSVDSVNFVEGYNTLNGRTDRFRPLIGGVQVYSLGDNSYSTIGFSVFDNQGGSGVVVSGHAVEGVGDDIFQPTWFTRI